MEMLSSVRGDKHEFCLLSLSLAIFAGTEALTSLMHDCVE